MGSLNLIVITVIAYLREANDQKRMLWRFRHTEWLHGYSRNFNFVGLRFEAWCIDVTRKTCRGAHHFVYASVWWFSTAMCDRFHRSPKRTRHIPQFYFVLFSFRCDFECFAHACRPMMIIRSAPFASVVRSLVCLFVRDLDQCGTVCWRRRWLFSHSHSSRTRVCVIFFLLSLSLFVSRFTGFAKTSSQRQSTHCFCCKLFAVILRIFVGFSNSSFSLILFVCSIFRFVYFHCVGYRRRRRRCR